jgi:hypothetical protein
MGTALLRKKYWVIKDFTVLDRVGDHNSGEACMR